MIKFLARIAKWFADIFDGDVYDPDRPPPAVRKAIAEQMVREYKHSPAAAKAAREQ